MFKQFFELKIFVYGVCLPFALYRANLYRAKISEENQGA